VELMDEKNEGEGFLYEVTFEVGPKLLVEERDSEYVVHIHGTITREVESDGERPERIGRVKAVLFRGRDLLNNGVHPFDSFDCVSEDTEDLYHSVYDGTGHIHDNVMDLCDDFPSNVLAVMFVGVEPRYRGKGVGRVALVRLIQIFGGDALVVLKNMPMVFENGEMKSMDPKERKELWKGRQAMWMKMGFVPSPLRPDDSGHLIGEASYLCWGSNARQ